MIPSIWEMFHPITMNTAHNTVIPTRNGKSFSRTLFSISRLLSSAAIPITISMLNKLLPITLPTAMALLPVHEEVMETAASGALVPNATIVRPTIIVGIFKSEATLLAPSTKKSDPLIKNTKPTSNKTTCNNIDKSMIIPLLILLVVLNQLQESYQFDVHRYPRFQR